MLKRICKSCNTEFIANNNNQKFCTKKCRNIKISCIQCNTEFDMYHARRTKFCSTNCYHIYQVENKKQDICYIVTCKHCQNKFSTKKSDRLYCNRNCMYEYRKLHNKETRICLYCTTEFITYKKSKKRCCSINCSLHYKPNQESRINGFKAVKYIYGAENIMQLSEYRQKILNTKLQKYGDSTYNNMEKNRATCMERYGVPYGVLKAKSNGIGISKPQQKLYDLIKEKYSNAILEYQIPELNISVDMYIPDRNLMIEFFGDYWHCNPSIYNKDYWHKYIHKTAECIWKKDKERIDMIKQLGYNVLIIWESDFNTDINSILESI